MSLCCHISFGFDAELGNTMRALTFKQNPPSARALCGSFEMVDEMACKTSGTEGPLDTASFESKRTYSSRSRNEEPP
jgi:hypothetical protein